jgi:hypothetical protein
MAETPKTPWSEILQAESGNWSWDAVIKRFSGEPAIERAYAASQLCGLWDLDDAVVGAILQLVEAQNELAQAISAEQYADVADAPEIGPALAKRVEAAATLIRALLLETENIWTPQGWCARARR